MSRSVGRAGPVSVTTVRAVWFRGRSSTDRSHSKSPPRATFSFAARNRFAMSSSICEARPESIFNGRVWLHKSMTTSRTGCEQQMSRLPSAGFSSG